MRYLGNKDSITDNIRQLLADKQLLDQDLTFFDAFCGTGAVSDALKDCFHIVINDNLNWSVIYSYGRLVAGSCQFAGLGFDPFHYFNDSTDTLQGFIYFNYSPGGSQRMYFSAENAARIDYFRNEIESWKDEQKITQEEYAYLLACLIESVSSVSNTAGVYGAFLKHWDSRALKPIEFIKVASNPIAYRTISFFNEKIEHIIGDVQCDVLYLDPPYTQNQYGTQYHLLETLVLDDSPSLSAITGSRPTTPMRSDWSKDYKAHILFDNIIAKTKAKYILFSYNNAGIMSKDFIEASLKRYGVADSYICKKIPYKKYQNWKSKNENEHFEYLFFIEKKPEHKVAYESPLNYTGSKAKMMEDIHSHLPEKLNTFVDLFGGGFNVGININADTIVYNEINIFVKQLVESFRVHDTYEYLLYMKKMIKKFGLEPAHAENYLAARNYYNRLEPGKRDPRLLYTVIMYGFQQQIRFNNNYGFNNPVGMRWFNDKVLEKMISFSRVIKERNVVFTSVDFAETSVGSDAFVYMDPPYRLTIGSYNDGKRGFSGWNVDEEARLFQYVDSLNQQGIKFMISYVLGHNDEINNELQMWLDERKYHVVNIPYIPGRKRKEILIKNYE